MAARMSYLHGRKIWDDGQGVGVVVDMYQHPSGSGDPQLPVETHRILCQLAFGGETYLHHRKRRYGETSCRQSGVSLHLVNLADSGQKASYSRQTTTDSRQNPTELTPERANASDTRRNAQARHGQGPERASSMSSDKRATYCHGRKRHEDLQEETAAARGGCGAPSSWLFDDFLWKEIHAATKTSRKRLSITIFFYPLFNERREGIYTWTNHILKAILEPVTHAESAPGNAGKPAHQVGAQHRASLALHVPPTRAVGAIALDAAKQSSDDTNGDTGPLLAVGRRRLVLCETGNSHSQSNLGVGKSVASSRGWKPGRPAICSMAQSGNVMGTCTCIALFAFLPLPTEPHARELSRDELLSEGATEQQRGGHGVGTARAGCDAHIGRETCGVRVKFGGRAGDRVGKPGSVFARAKRGRCGLGVDADWMAHPSGPEVPPAPLIRPPTSAPDWHSVLSGYQSPHAHRGNEGKYPTRWRRRSTSDVAEALKRCDG
ncbi:hypothetical protein B0H10DRAFT_1941911 [Mycena sp. CBHHK59/15]|nr:hypothetical protein B0H10DRAFT_1941911 [Mycena sp. CBHHK59/15]